MAHLIEPGFSVETAGFDNQRVTIPLRYRVAEPLRIRIFGQFTPIHKKLAELVEGFVEHHDDVGLKDLEGERRGVNLRNALRQAVGVGVLCGERAILALVVDRLGPRVMLTSPGFKPAVASLSLGGSAIQIPVRSGLPSARRGAGADRFG